MKLLEFSVVVVFMFVLVIAIVLAIKASV